MKLNLIYSSPFTGTITSTVMEFSSKMSKEIIEMENKYTNRRLHMFDPVDTPILLKILKEREMIIMKYEK